MTKKDFKKLSDYFSPKIATSFQLMEKSFDDYFLKKKKFKKSDYKVGKDVVCKNILDAIPGVMAKSMADIEKITIESLNKNKKSK